MKMLVLDDMTITPAVARAMAGVQEVKLESGVEVDDWDGLKVELTAASQENGGLMEMLDRTGIRNLLSKKYGGKLNNI